MRIASNTHLSAKRGSSSNQKEKESYCHEKSYDRSSSFGRSCPRVYLYADEGTKSRISIPRISTGDGAVANITSAFTFSTARPGQVSPLGERNTQRVHRGFQ